MFLRIATIAFLFLIRLRFPQSKSVSQIIRSQYVDTTIKRLRKLEKIDNSLRKADSDLKFLITNRDNNLILRFLNIRLAKKSMRSSLTYAHVNQIYY